MSLCAILAGCGSKEEVLSINEQLTLGDGHWIWYAETEEIYLKSDGRLLEVQTKEEPSNYRGFTFQGDKIFIFQGLYPDYSEYNYWITDGVLYRMRLEYGFSIQMGKIAVAGDYMTLKYVCDYGSHGYPQETVLARCTVTFVRTGNPQ